VADASPHIVSARVIPWEPTDVPYAYGVAISWSDRKHVAYRVGSRKTAEREVRRVLAGQMPLHLVDPLAD
jgi:hypothetical protein